MIHTGLAPKAVMQIQKFGLPNSSNIGKFRLMLWFQDSEKCKLLNVQDQSYIVSISSSKRKLVSKTELTKKTVRILKYRLHLHKKELYSFVFKRYHIAKNCNHLMHRNEDFEQFLNIKQKLK